jgi:GntR family transcriptional regulator
MPGSGAYIRVADDLRRRIEGGELPPGSRLPSRSEIAERYGVGSNVAIAAVRRLRGEGLVTSRAGSGVYVASPEGPWHIIRSGSPRPPGTTLGIREIGYIGADSSSGRGSMTIPAPAGIAARLAIPVGERVTRSVNRYDAGGRPAMLSVGWEPLSLTGGTASALPDAGPLAGHNTIERMALIGLCVTRSEETVEARMCTSWEAGELLIDSASVVLAIERTYVAGEHPVHTTDLIVPAARYRLVYEFPVEHG